MSFLPQNKFADAVFAYAEGIAIFIAGLMTVFGAIILVLSGGYLLVAYFQKLLGVSGLTITALDVINKAESLMFFAFITPIEVLVGLIAIGWNGIGQIIYDIGNLIISLLNNFVIDPLSRITGVSSHIGSIIWTYQDTTGWITIITQIQTNLQSILFPPL